jgi:MFS family permease
VTDRDVPAGGYRKVLRQPVAARLLTAQAVSELGDFVGTAALVVLGYAASGSALGGAAVFTAQALLGVLAGTLGGRFIDGAGRRSVLVGTALVGSAVVGLAALRPSVPTALAAAALLGAGRVLYQGAFAGLMKTAVPEQLQPTVLAASGVVNQLAQVFGLLVGASASLVVGVRPALALDCLSFLLAAAVLATLPPGGRAVPATRPAPLDGLRLILAHPVLRRVAGVAWVCFLAAWLPEALAPAIAPGPWGGVAMAAAPLTGAIGFFVVGRLSLLTSVRAVLHSQLLLGGVLLLSGVALWLRPGIPTAVAVNLLLGLVAVSTFGVELAFIRHSPAASVAHINSTMVATIGLVGGVGALLGGAVAHLGEAVPYLLVGALVTAVAGPAVIRERRRPAVLTAKGPVVG